MVDHALRFGAGSMVHRWLTTYVRPTLGKKLAMFCLLFLVGTYANLHYAITLFGSLDSSASIVNETGTLRYLSQRIAFIGTRLEPNDRQDMAALVKNYDTTLNGIAARFAREGKPLIDQMPAIEDKLKELRQIWKVYADAAIALSSSRGSPAKLSESRADLQAAADPMLAVANDIVDSLTESDRQVRDRVRRQIHIAILLEAAFLLLVFFFIQRGVSRPIRKLAHLCQSFAAGEHSLRMNFNSCDEVGDLVASFNRTAEITSRLILDLNLRTREAKMLHRVGLVFQEHASQSVTPDIPAALDSVVRLVPDGWQFAEVAAARIVCREVSVESDDFRETPWRLDAETTSTEGMPIRISVCYRESRADADIGPFLAEEKELLNDLAGMIKTFIDGADARRARNSMLSILENTTDLVATFHPDGRIIYLNEAARNLFAVEPGGNGDNISRHYPEWAKAAHQHAALPDARKGGVWSGELAVLDAGGREIPVSQTLLTHRNAHGGIEFYSFIARDISETKRVAAQLERLANHDSLTGLPNRNLLMDRLEQATTLARRQGTELAVMFIDLDRFKIVNDTLGHDVGDELLVVLGQRLRDCLREGDTVARIGGDEFVVLLPDIGAEPEDANQLEHIARKLIVSLADPVQLGEQELFVSASLGISLYPADGIDPTTLLKHADIAMYRAKEEGRNNHQFYRKEMSANATERLSMENHLRRALENDEFTLHYQPQVEARSGRIVGMEALIRWNNPTLGKVPPGDFIPLTEETGLIVPIGEWVLKTACAQNKAWQDAGLPPVRVAVNLSARQFRSRNIVSLVANTLEATGLEGRYLDIELTESMLMHDPEGIIDILKQLKALGVRIALDDFGTGYSSLAYLKRYPIDEIKIDRSFVREILQDSDDAAIVNAILGMSRGLALATVAEGVETLTQQHYLREHDCDRMQGYLFGHPSSADEIAKLLARTLPAGEV
ncbi:MAG: EAL domain-containing protein [Sulfuritalea sp.]|nr:EAL domain-containing protein [Sulfuritalea sp.]